MGWGTLCLCVCVFVCVRVCIYVCICVSVGLLVSFTVFLHLLGIFKAIKYFQLNIVGGNTNSK